MRSLVIVIGSAFFVMLICGCSTEEQRYLKNKAGAHLSPRSKAALSAKDVDEICRLIAHETRKLVICVSMESSRMFPNTFEVVVAYSWRENFNAGEFPSQFGSYQVRREKQGWRILEGGDCTGALIGIRCEDKPD